MKTSLQFLCLIFLLPITNSAGSSCAFTGACLYNINVHHCDGHIKRSLTGSGLQLCPCSDVTTLQNRQQNLSSWIGTISTTFHRVRAELVGLKEELKEKSTELAAISGRNKQDNATLQKYNKETLTTEIAISNERQIWFTERDRLQNELHRVITESQVCQQVTTTSSSSHQGNSHLVRTLVLSHLIQHIVNHNGYIIFNFTFILSKGQLLMHRSFYSVILKPLVNVGSSRTTRMTWTGRMATEHNLRQRDRKRTTLTAIPTVRCPLLADDSFISISTIDTR